MRYRNLFQPIVLGGQELKNRIVMAPMGCGKESQYGDGRVSTELIDFFEERAKGGVGMIISPFTAVDRRYYTLTLGLFSREHVLGISRLAEALKVFDCKFILQLSHFGGKSPKGFEYDRPPIAPSAIESIMYPVKPLEMSCEQIEETIGLYIQAAEWAKDAGCAGVELHAAHGYLINQFISPHANRRSDEYGGSLEKRMRFVTRIAEAIRRTCGKDFIIGIKYSGHEHLEGGIDTGEAVRIGQFLDAQGLLDYLHISAFTTLLPGFLDCDYPSVPPIYTPHPLVPIAHEVKKAVRMPVIATAGITDPGYADRLLGEGKADLVAMARALIADPDWANKARHGGNIRPCILCNTCYHRGMQQKVEKCAVNAYLGEERKYQAYLRTRAEPGRKVLVVGAGPAGLEAALTADRRTHRVTLLEKEPDIGGLMRCGSIPPFKENIARLIGYYRSELEKSGVEVRVGVEATADSILREDAEVIVLAAGGKPVRPPIPGLHGRNVYTAADALRSEGRIAGSRVVVIGAGFVGCEVGLYLAQKGKTVTVVDWLPFEKLLSEDHPVNRSMLIRSMRKAGVQIVSEGKVTAVKPDRILAQVGAACAEQEFGADAVVVAAGYQPDRELELALSKALEDSSDAPELYRIGDCRKCGKIFDAVNSGANLAWRI